MPDGVGELLESLDRSSSAAAPPPPPAFLAAVARRRHRRRLTHAATGVVAFAVLIAASMVIRAPGPVPAGPAHPGDLMLVAKPAPASLGHLTRLNPNPGAENLVLPSMPGGGVEEPLHIGLRWDAAAVEQWIAN